MNAVVEAIVEAFQRARPVALEVARYQSMSIHRTSPKRKLDDEDVGSESGETSRKRTRSSNRILSRQSHRSGVEEVQDISDDDRQAGKSHPEL